MWNQLWWDQYRCARPPKHLKTLLSVRRFLTLLTPIRVLRYIGHLKAFSKQLKAQLVQNPSLRVRFAWHQATAICVKDHSRLGDARSTPKMQIHSLAAHKIFKECRFWLW